MDTRSRANGRIHHGTTTPTDIIQAGCLKVTCPGRLQAGTCLSRRKSRQCIESIVQGRPRTSLSAWWLS